MIIFDCYGSGGYLDADAYRHRPQDAFLQLSNDLARRLRIPLLVMNDRLNSTTRCLRGGWRKPLSGASRADDALLRDVLSMRRTILCSCEALGPPAERSFVHDFMTLGELPGNVRFILTGRTGRLPTSTCRTVSL